MVSFHVWTLVWIIVLLFDFTPIVEGNSAKHRATHRHRNHRHRKHPKHRPPPMKNSSEKYPRKMNMTKILDARYPLLPTERFLHFSNSTYPTNETIIASSENLSTVKNTTNIIWNNDIYNSTPDGIDENSSRSNETSGLPTVVNDISRTSMKSSVENSPKIPAGQIDDQVGPSFLSLRAIPQERRAIGTSSSRSLGAQEDHRRYANDLRELFGTEEEQTILPKIPTNVPIVRLVRKKRSIQSEEAEATEESSREAAILDLNGPSIANDPEEMLDRDSPESFHKRVKRDDPEPEETPSALSSQDSNYFRDLEDSFALSALEVEARESRGSEGNRRTARQSRSGIESLPILSRSKRHTGDLKNQSFNTGGHSVEFENAASADYIVGKEDTDSLEENHEKGDRRNASSRDLLGDGTDRTNGTVGVLIGADLSSESVDNFSRIAADVERLGNTTHGVDFPTSPVSTTPEAEDKKTYTLYIDSESGNSNPNDLTLKGSEESITGYRVEDVENEENKTSASFGGRETNEREIEETSRRSEVESVTVDSSLKDDNSISRYGLDDVYPEIIEDPANPSSMVRLVRTKRFGDGLGNAETLDASYGSELDNSRVSEGSYAEDNRIIDSMLSKVDYRSSYAQPRENEARLGEEDVSSSTGERTPVRNKRGVSSVRARKKGGGRRRGSKKRKKSHEARAKKHHRPKLKDSKMKRESGELSEGMNFDWDEKFEPADEKFDGRRLDAIDREIVSPHDGRRRRVSEDEDDENFYPDTNEAAARFRRDLRDSENVKENSKVQRDETARSIGAFAEEDNKLDEKRKNREKRNNGLPELKYFQNIRETDSGRNGTEEIAGNRLLSVDAVEPIREIEQIAEELLAKVNELHGYVSKVGAGRTVEDSQASGTASSAVDPTNAGRSKVVDGVSTSLDGTSSRPTAANVERQPEACQNPASWTRQSGPAKSNGRSARNLRAQRCGKKARRKRTSHRKWDRWTDWSSCSVTCGRGRQIRWRHCIRNCSTAETEMEEKACQLPACAPGKFLGIFG